MLDTGLWDGAAVRTYVTHSLRAPLRRHLKTETACAVDPGIQKKKNALRAAGRESREVCASCEIDFADASVFFCFASFAL